MLVRPKVIESETSPRLIRITLVQFDIMVSFMERHGDLSEQTGDARSKVKNVALWQELTVQLNSNRSGLIKTATEWRKIWSDFKNKIKSKTSIIIQGTKHSDTFKSKLTELEVRVLAIMGQTQNNLDLLGVTQHQTTLPHTATVKEEPDSPVLETVPSPQSETVVPYDSRESAFVHALSAAALAHAVARACSRGELNECSCDARVRRRAPRNWQWGGCSEDIRYGEMFSRDFVDSKEDKMTDEGIMNLHNNEAGRRAVRARMQRVCKCHGMSGSCSVRVCWRRLPLLRSVGDALAQRYEGASHVKVVERKKGRNLKKLRPAHADMKKPNKTDLVYLADSPDYCEPDEQLGVLGTRGRLCNRTSAGLDGCRLLCCGRGYQTRVRDHEDKCRCRFVWCCSVKCEVCRSKREEHVCN